jgi:HEPN domain-containing protein
MRSPKGASLSTFESRDLASVLARKAEGDAKAMRRLASDPEIDDEAVGFHAEQAIEKWLKAVIIARGMSTEGTRHDLVRLLRILAVGGVESPPDAERLAELAVYGARARYENVVDLEPLDRDAVDSVVAAVGEWAAAQIG